MDYAFELVDIQTSEVSWQNFEEIQTIEMHVLLKMKLFGTSENDFWVIIHHRYSLPKGQA